MLARVKAADGHTRFKLTSCVAEKNPTSVVVGCSLSIGSTRTNVQRSPSHVEVIRRQSSLMKNRRKNATTDEI